MEVFRAVFVAIIVGLLTWSLRQPAQKLENGGIVMRNSKVVYAVMGLPAMIFLLILPLALTECGMGKDSLILIGISVFLTLLYAWLVVFLNNQKIIATDEGITGKKGSLKWDEIKEVRYNSINGRIKLLGDTACITVNLEMIGGVEFLYMMRDKLPEALCGVAIEKAARRMKRYGFR